MGTKEELLARELIDLSFRIGDENVSTIWENKKSIKNFLDHGSYIGLSSRLKGSAFAEKLRILCSSSMQSKVLEGSRLLHDLFLTVYNEANENKLTSSAAWNLGNFVGSMPIIGKIIGGVAGEIGQKLADDATDNIRSQKETEFIDSAERFRDAYQIALTLITIYLCLSDRKKVEEAWTEASYSLEEMYMQRKLLLYYKYPFTSPAVFQFYGIKDPVFEEIVRAVANLTK